jgi:hypothetical protein
MQACAIGNRAARVPSGTDQVSLRFTILAARRVLNRKFLGKPWSGAALA